MARKRIPHADHSDGPVPALRKARPRPHRPAKHEAEEHFGDLSDPRLYLDREFSLLAFQRRVLQEAEDPQNPPLERAKFLSILTSNLDEFFMVRVAVIKQKLASGLLDPTAEGKLALNHQLDAIRADVMQLMEEAYRCFREQVMPALEEAGIELLQYSSLSKAEKASLEAYFQQTVFPVLTPLAFDPGRPFPHISNLSLNIAVVVRDAQHVEHFARVKVPETLPKLIPVPEPAPAPEVPQAGVPAVPVRPRQAFVWLEQMIMANLQRLFPGMEIVEAHAFHVTRDAEVVIQEFESDDLLETIEEAVWQRRFRAVVRLQVNQYIPSHILDILVENLEMDPKDVYRVAGPLDLSRLRQLMTIDRPDLKDKPFAPYTPPELMPKAEEDLFTLLRRQDILLHHPFDSFQPVVEFLRKAARDPHVLAIKMTLYRVGRNSPIVEALVEAVENGKEVAVMVELKARFDEESNIEWARALEREGVHVVYGILGLKVHSKVALVVRREGEAIRRYVHLGTGNYNPVTARLYTDMSFFTSNESIAADISELFNYLTGYSSKTRFGHLMVAPATMRSGMAALIRREIEWQKKGERGHIIFKMNALEDYEMIRLLYEASQAGVQVDLLVRGICCLRPGIPGISEHIRVTSIIGRFLEHSRIYYFRNGGEEEVYAGSADLMPRNLDHRVEIVFPIADARLVKRLRDDILTSYLNDTKNARVMKSDGTYVRKSNGDHKGEVDSQSFFIEHAAAARA
ncbi:MAG: Polyphosphate kinase [Bryobacterales bacterium]|nr:Polyphosphate kinase [Bryobacterales bacterium]